MLEKPVIRIGVTGHRYLRDVPALMSALLSGLARLKERYAESHWVLYSPLAPGSDQLAGQAALACSIPLVVVLPFNEECYLNTFPEDGRAAYHRMVCKATEVIELPAMVEGEPAYEALGRHIAANMDVLIAIWNGEPARGQGGTGEVVENFRMSGKPLMWVRADNMLPGNPVRLPPEMEQGSIVYENW